MKTKAIVLKIEDDRVWLAVEPESCSICSVDNPERAAACSGCENHALPPFEARNSRGLSLKPGMKVSAAFPRGRAPIQAAVSFGIPAVAALAAYLSAPAAKPVAALAALVAAALVVCGLSTFMRKKFPNLYGEMEIAEILEEPAARHFPVEPSFNGGEISQTPWHSG